LEFVALDALTQAALTLVGNFESNTSDSIIYFMREGEEELTENDDFIIIENGLYLKKDIQEYNENTYPLSIVAFRIDPSPNINLSERIELPIEVDVTVPILPIKLTNFQVKIENKTILLNWETITETNNQGFSIERSKDGINWEKIGWQDGRGNSLVPHSYRHVDETPLSGTSYYRLQQVDFDGVFSYSEIVSVRFQDNPDFSLYPNPTKEILNISGIKHGENKQITIHNQAGRTVSNITQNTNRLDVSALIPGLYMITVTTDNDVFYGKFIVN